MRSERLAVTRLHNVVQASAYAAVAVARISEARKTYASVASAVHFGRVDDFLTVCVENLRLELCRKTHIHATFVLGILNFLKFAEVVGLGIAVFKRVLYVRRNAPAEVLLCAFFCGLLNCRLDFVDGLRVALRNDNRASVLCFFVVFSYLRGL